MDHLIGKVVMVDPSIADFCTHGLAKIGIITAADPHNDRIQVEFLGRWREDHSATTLLTLKPPEEIRRALLESKLKSSDKKIITPILFSAEHGVHNMQYHCLETLLHGKKALQVAAETVRELLSRSPKQLQKKFGYGR
ncbi:hypothetical protein BWD42_06990 [Sphingobacterium sp. CZ-UAM]|uniref:hypothetical protein n=1 Tax=Sphingobacterium sp. CZ-UAM TaxID=1933868 RepID=UPI00098553DB|nr:hypothetical protein [Sphingobacterium sp. CZ-UAM]OOG19651.1 hypothetical protein BWD42_06990 [Sphingobacterium sp. CZ-UAM]